MKKIITIAILASITSMANAGEVKKPGETSLIKEPTKFSYDLGLETYRETYKEYNTEDNNSTFMKEEANMYGVNGKLSYQATPVDKFVFRTRYATGDSEYTGSRMGEAYGSLIVDGQDRNVWEFGAEYQHKFIELNDVNMGFGVNYRELTDRLDQAGIGGYKRVNQLSYANFSLDKEFNVHGWKVTPKLNVKALLDGKQKSYLDPEYTLAHKQGSGHGYDLELAFVKKVSNYNLAIVPYFKSMSIGNSDQLILTDGVNSIVTMEPKNKTTEAGITIGLQF